MSEEKTERQVGEGFHRPVCIRCKCEMQPIVNGAGVLDLDANGKPYKLYDVDIWRCPGCSCQVAGGFARNPVAHSGDDDLQERIDGYEVLIRNTGSYVPQALPGAVPANDLDAMCVQCLARTVGHSCPGVDKGDRCLGSGPVYSD